jgi:hypothetical protein
MNTFCAFTPPALIRLNRSIFLQIFALFGLNKLNGLMRNQFAQSCGMFSTLRLAASRRDSKCRRHEWIMERVSRLLSLHGGGRSRSGRQ